MMNREQDSNSDLTAIKEIENSLQSLEECDEKPVAFDTVYVKEEYIVSEDTEDQEFYLKHVNYESESDNEQGSTAKSSCNYKPTDDEANFIVDTDVPCNVDTNRKKLKHQDHKCIICNKYFLKKKHFKVHMKIHKNVRNHKCQICNKEFARKANFIRHLEVHEGIKNFKCSICDKKFTQVTHLKVHTKRHEGIKDYKCSVCNKKFLLNGDLVRHMKIHEGVRDFKCSICDKKFLLKCNLKLHMKIHAGIRDFKCSVCDKEFVRKDHLTRHMIKHTK